MPVAADQVPPHPKSSTRSPAGRVLLLSELYPPAVGGSAVLLHGIYSRLSEAQVTVLTDGVGPRDGEQQGKVRVVRRAIASTRWGLRDLGALRAHLRTARHVRSLVPPDGAVVHCARALPEGVAAMFSGLISGAPYAVWAHGEDIVSALTSRELTILTKAVLRRASATFANSRNTAGLLRSIGVPEARIHVVHPAVDADRFHPGVDGSSIRARFAPGGEILLLSVGRLQRRKGHDAAIEAVAALRNEIPGLKYVIAGDGEERARLEQLVADLRAADRVMFAGIVPDHELPAYYAASDVFLLPNRIDQGDIEGFGIVFLEAAASGRPAIGGDSGGVPEAVEKDVTGLLVDGSAAAVASAIRQLATSAELRSRMGHAGRTRAVSQFGWQRAATAVASIQHALMAAR